MSDKTRQMAEQLYQSMCDYVGPNHPEKSVEAITFTLDSMEVEIERLTKERDALQDRVDDLIYEVRRMRQ